MRPHARSQPAGGSNGFVSINRGSTKTCFLLWLSFHTMLAQSHEAIKQQDKSRFFKQPLLLTHPLLCPLVSFRIPQRHQPSCACLRSHQRATGAVQAAIPGFRRAPQNRRCGLARWTARGSLLLVIFALDGVGGTILLTTRPLELVVVVFFSPMLAEGLEFVGVWCCLWDFPLFFFGPGPLEVWESSHAALNH